jgi:hypothetical protein
VVVASGTLGDRDRDRHHGRDGDSLVRVGGGSMTEIEIQHISPDFAIRHSKACVASQRPIGWLMVRALLETIGRLRAQRDEFEREAAALMRELSRCRGKGEAGEPRL